MRNKRFAKILALVLSGAMVVTMVPVNSFAKNTAKPKTMSFPKTSLIKVNQTKTIVATRYNKKSTTQKKYAKFKPSNTKNVGITVVSSDDAIVSVNREGNAKYTYTGINTGTANLTITSKYPTAKGSRLKRTFKVTVINPFKTQQVSAYKFRFSTASNLNNIRPSDIKVVQEGNVVNNAVKKVTLADDKKSATVEMLIPFVDNKRYDVEVGGKKDSFTASVGAPAAINFETQSAVVNKPTKVKFSVRDSNGIDITDVIDKNRLTVDIDSRAGYYDSHNQTLTLWQVGGTANAKATYHTWTYDQSTGRENVIQGTGLISCVPKSAVTVTGIDKWTVADRILNWETDPVKTVMPQGTSSRLWIRIKQSDGTYVDNKKNPSAFTFKPVNTANVYVTSDGSVYATRQGTEYILVTYMDGNLKYQYTLPITVGPVAKAVGMTITPPTVVIPKDSSANCIITMAVKDQYGNNMKNSGMPSAQLLQGDDVMILSDEGYSDDGTLKKLGIKSNGKQGQGVYRFTYNNFSNIVRVNALNVDNAPVSYDFEKENYTTDISCDNSSTISSMDKLAKGVNLKVLEKKAGLGFGNGTGKFKLDDKAVKVRVLENGYEVPAAPFLSQDSNNNIYFTPVVKDGNGNYIITAKKAMYTVELSKTMNNVNYRLSTKIEVKNSNDSVEPVVNKTYKFDSITKDKDATLQSVTDEAVVNLLDSKNPGLKESYKYTTIYVDGSNVSKYEDNSKKFSTADAREVSITRTALPVFLTKAENNKQATVWKIKDNLNEKLTIKDAPVLTDKALKVDSKAEFNATDKKDATKTVKLSFKAKNATNIKGLDNMSSWILDGKDKGFYEINSIKANMTADEVKAEVTLKLTKDLQDGKTDVNLKFDNSKTAFQKVVTDKSGSLVNINK